MPPADSALAVPADGHGFLDEARARVLASLDRAAREGVSDPVILKQAMREAASTLFRERTQRRPVIVPTVMEV